MRIIAGRWKGRRLRPPRGRAVRPTTDRVREAWMSALGSAVSGARVLDLFAGSGALGLEALSRGAAHVVFVDRARSALGTLRANVELVGAAAECTVIERDAFRYVSSLGREDFDVALADPPYGEGAAARLLELYLRTPFAREFWLEHPTRETLPWPDDARTRRYGDTSLTSLRTDS